MNPYQASSTEAEDWEPEVEPDYWQPEYWEEERWKRESRRWKLFIAIVIVVVLGLIAWEVSLHSREVH